MVKRYTPDRICGHNVIIEIPSDHDFLHETFGQADVKPLGHDQQNTLVLK